MTTIWFTVLENSGLPLKMHKTITSRQMKTFNQEDSLNCLFQIDWKGIVSQSDNINLVVEQWTPIFSLILEKNAPLTNRRVTDPWVTKDLRQMYR